MSQNNKPQFVHYKSLRETEYIGSWDVIDRGDVDVCIDGIPKRFVPPVKRMKNGKPEQNRKYEIRLRNQHKSLIAGPTIQDTIASLHGPNMANWDGKWITLYYDPSVKMGGRVTGGIRVRPSVPSGKAGRPLNAPVDRDMQARQQAAADEAVGHLVGNQREPGED